jgi:Uma2 family endonuclease
VKALREKCRAFRRNGVTVCWLFDPEKRTLEIFESGADGVHFEGDTLTSSALPGFELNLPVLWATLDR